MATANPIVTSLTKYVEEHLTELIAKTVLPKDAQMFNLLTGVKGPSTLNLLSTDVVLQDAHACGWTESGSTAISQRVLNPAYLKVNHAWCEKNLLGTYAQYLVRTAASDQPEEEFGFEKQFVDGVIAKINEAQTKMLYQGVSGATSHDGLITVLSGATGTNIIEKASGTSVYSAIKETYMAMPEEVLAHDDAVILVSDGIFRAFIQELVAANLYHFNPNDKDGEYLLPGTNVKVIAQHGLNGISDYDAIIAGRLSNVFVGVDLMNEEEKFDIWFSKDNREWRFDAEWIAGVQVAYPNEMVLTTIAKAGA